MESGAHCFQRRPWHGDGLAPARAQDAYPSRAITLIVPQYVTALIPVEIERHRTLLAGAK